jgi:hypothetical protein
MLYGFRLLVQVRLYEIRNFNGNEERTDQGRSVHVNRVSRGDTSKN